MRRVYKQRWSNGPTEQEIEEFWQIRRELEAKFVVEDARYEARRDELRNQLQAELRRQEAERHVAEPAI